MEYQGKENNDMTKDELNKLIADMTLKNFEANKDYMMKTIMDCSKREAEKGDIDMYSLFPQLLVLMSKVTVEISTATTLSVLHSLGMFDPDDFEKKPPEKPVLYVVKD